LQQWHADTGLRLRIYCDTVYNDRDRLHPGRQLHRHRVTDPDGLQLDWYMHGLDHRRSFG
jgi:hypothetical protein